MSESWAEDQDAANSARATRASASAVSEDRYDCAARVSPLPACAEPARRAAARASSASATNSALPRSWCGLANDRTLERHIDRINTYTVLPRCMRRVHGVGQDANAGDRALEASAGQLFAHAVEVAET